MKIIATLIAAIGLAGMTGGAGAEPILGTWQTEVDDGSFAYVQVAPCGGGFCGTITRTFNSGGEYRSPNVGKQIVREMAPQGGGAYEGRVWRPSNDKVYLGKAQVDGDRLRLRGCVAGGLICASQIWARID
jgi:uncharacterized protein (DUF2147 family)